MIEKVAKAIYNMSWPNKSLSYKATKPHCMALAKAVIEALREPTDDMANEYYKLSYNTEVFYVATWQRSIDAILAEKC